jgi:hypothetical protein
MNNPTTPNGTHNADTQPTAGEVGPAAAGPNGVNGTLTPDRRTRPAVENPDYAAFARRVIRAAGRRVAAGDVEGLADLLHLSGELDMAIDTAVTGLRAAGYSWAEVASRLGITRQAAQQRWAGR